LRGLQKTDITYDDDLDNEPITIAIGGAPDDDIEDIQDDVDDVRLNRYYLILTILRIKKIQKSRRTNRYGFG